MGTSLKIINNQPQITVIVPAFNCAKTLERCVASIRRSLSSEDEVLIVDDGSTDCTLSLARKLSDIYPNVKVISQKNGGVSAARNAGILEAQGKFVAFVDSDDWIEQPYSLFSNLFESLSASEAEFAIAGYSTDSHEESLVLTSEIYRMNEAADAKKILMKRSLGKPYGKLIRRDFLIDNHIFFPVGMKHQEDAVFFYRMLAKANLVVTVADSSYHYLLPDKNKNYGVDINIQLLGYNAMKDAVEKLLSRYSTKDPEILDRLNGRIDNLSLHVYDSIIHEKDRSKRLRAYKQVKWEGPLHILAINPIKKLLMKLRLFTLVDLV